MGRVLVNSQGQGEGGGSCRRRWVVGKVQGGSRGSVGFSAWGVTPAAAVR